MRSRFLCALSMLQVQLVLQLIYMFEGSERTDIISRLTRKCNLPDEKLFGSRCNIIKRVFFLFIVVLATKQNASHQNNLMFVITKFLIA